LPPLVTSRPDLQPLVWGERILHRRGFRRYERVWPARYSDPLWMRLVTNTLLAYSDADLVVARNVQRSSDMIGPVSRAVFDVWLGTNESLREVRVEGAALLALGRRLLAQDEPGARPPPPSSSPAMRMGRAARSRR
jgi:hypothetical protein